MTIKIESQKITSHRGSAAAKKLYTIPNKLDRMAITLSKIISFIKKDKAAAAKDKCPAIVILIPSKSAPFI